METSHSHHHPGDHGRSWHDYLPLLTLLAVAALVALAVFRSYGPGVSHVRAMHAFMGFFLVVFAMLKLFDLRGFADGFQMYDLLAKRSRAYALAYPFLELALGLAYLAFLRPDAVYLATVVLMGFGALGVISALRRGLDVNCACMGTTLKVPLSTVALVEDLAMAAMAAVMWLRLQF
ncbi:MAG TPA: MauE/DoxX family redox-associated membrane protein [Opitutaceae bacterium]|nr:MauE/DoxX family redox-associated membrane protein [Opitutaceae bacterium]